MSAWLSGARISAVPVEHEPLRPVACRPVLVLVHDAQDVADGAGIARRHEELDRPLGHVADRPGGTAVLLETVRCREVDHGIDRIPAQQVVDASEVLRGSGVCDLAAECRPVTELGPIAVGRRLGGW